MKGLGFRMKVEKVYTMEGVIEDAISNGYDYEQFESVDNEIVIRVTETPFDAVEYVFTEDGEFIERLEDSVSFFI